MFKNVTLVVCAVAAAAAALVSEAGQDSRLQRGKYLVEQVSMCVDCHSPRNERGEFDKSRWLQGSKLDLQPVHPVPGWADYAPNLAGLPGWKDAYVTKLLETGLKPDGTPPRPPMPPYRMTREDAEAVVAYLRSLKPAPR